MANCRHRRCWLVWSMSDRPRLILYGRVYCHLCSEMEAALTPLREEMGFDLECVDVDAYPELEERFGDLVPVLVLDGRELCHYFLDEAAVRAGIRALSSGIH